MTTTGQPVKLPPRPGHDIGPAVPGIPMTVWARCSCSAEWEASDDPNAPTLAVWGLVHPHPRMAQAEEAAAGLQDLARTITQHPELVEMFRYSALGLPALEVADYDRLSEWLGTDHVVRVDGAPEFTRATRRFGPLPVYVTIRTARLTEAGR